VTRGIVAALAPVIVLSLLACGGREKASTAAGSAPAGAASAPGEGAPAPNGDSAPLPKTSVTLYFPSASSDALAAETREIIDTKGPADRGSQIIAALLDGPRTEGALAAAPPGTVLRHLWVRDDGNAYADFSEELAAGTNVGSWDEILTVYSIVDSLTENVPEIHRVGILVAGSQRQSFGHLDLSRPLPPDLTLAKPEKGAE
jgi:spore germination protein GerM